MKRFYSPLPLYLSLVVLLFNSCGGDDPEPLAHISGVVRNQTELVSGASVTLSDESETAISSATTDGAGFFIFEDLALGTYVVSVAAQDFGEEQQNVTLTAQGVEGLDFNLDSEVGDIFGAVYDQTTNAVLSGATIEASQSGSTMGSAVSDQYGEFRIANLDLGSYEIAVSLNGYTTENTNANINTNQDVELRIALEPEGFDITGTVTNVSAVGVSSATVTLATGGSTVGSGVTDGSGNFSISSIPSGSYDVSISRTGYTTFSGSLTVTGDTDEDFTIVGEATITGTVINSQTGSGLEGARVAFAEGATTSEADTSSPALITESNSSGTYTINNAPTGSYVCIITLTGFTDRVVENLTFSSGTNELAQSTVVETVGEGEIRVILTWGSSPRDLDTHLTGPASDASRFHMYFRSKTPSNSDVNLDVDDTSSFGPETTTIEELRDGTYRYSVHNYTNRFSSAGAQPIVDSPTVVEVFDSTGSIATYTPPTTGTISGDTWKVFEIQVSGGAYNLVTLNTYSLASSVSDTDSFRSGEKTAVFTSKSF